MAELPEESDPICDPDDIFDTVVMADERCQENGFDEGFQKGKKVGREQGIAMGREKGQQIGDEIGFYLGFAVAWKSLLERRRDEDPNSSERPLKSIESLIKALHQLPQEEPNSVKYWDRVQKIRAKFKQVGSLLRIPVSYSPHAVQKGFSF